MLGPTAAFLASAVAVAGYIVPRGPAADAPPTTPPSGAATTVAAQRAVDTTVAYTIRSATDTTCLVGEDAPHKLAVRSVDVDEGGRRLVSSSNDRRVRLWSLADGRCELLATAELDAPVERVLLDERDDVIYAGTERGELWRLERAGTQLLPNPPAALPVATARLRGIALLPGGDQLLVGGFDGALHHVTLPSLTAAAQPLLDIEDSVLDIDLQRRSDGTVQALVTAPGVAWRVPLDGAQREELHNGDVSVDAAAWFGDDRVAVADDTTLWIIDRGIAVTTYNSPSWQAINAVSGVRAEGRHLVAFGGFAGGPLLIVRDPLEPAARQVQVDRDGAVTTLDDAGDGRIAYGTADGAVAVVRLELA